MKNTKSLARQAALITALILSSSGWVSAQSHLWPTNRGQYNQGQYNPGQPGHPGTRMVRLPAVTDSFRSTSSQSPQLKKISKGSSLIGATVKNQQGENLGGVRDLVIDFSSGEVAYVVLDGSMGPHPGMESEPTEVMAKPAQGSGSIVPLMLYPPGFDRSSLLIYDPAVSYWTRWGSSNRTEVAGSQKLHAVPLRALQSDPTGTSLILNADKDKFEASAGFDQDNWPAVTTAAWGAEPFWKTPARTSAAPEPTTLDQHQLKARPEQK